MITDYEYIVLQDPGVWFGLLWLWTIPAGLSVLVTILYSIFATRRTFSGYEHRTFIPLGLSLFGFFIMFLILSGIQSNAISGQISDRLNDQFAKANYEGDLAFTATTEDDTIVRGALIPANDNGEFKRYAVIYVAVKEPGEE